MQFDKRVHDFGSIKEVDGPVAYDFEFVNTGSSPVLIKNVESSCGCTSPEWTKQPVLPGKRGFIKATFNPKDRPGYFDKTVTVYSNSRTAVVELKIKGTVEGKTRTVLDDYPYELASGLRLPLEDVSFMKIHKGLVKQIQMGVLNNAGKSVSVSFAALPAHLQMSIEPGQIPDKGQAVIKASYHSALHGDFGLNREQVTMLVDGKNMCCRFPYTLKRIFPEWMLLRLLLLRWIRNIIIWSDNFCPICYVYFSVEKYREESFESSPDLFQ